MGETIMIVVALGLTCEGETARMCRLFSDPAASRGTPALSSTPALPQSTGHRTKNALRDEEHRRAIAAEAAEERRPSGAVHR